MPGPAYRLIIATFTGTNDFSAGEAVTLSGFTNGTQFNGQTVTVLAAGLTATTFEAYFNSANASGIETRAVAGDAGPGYFNITEGYTCPSASTLVYLTVSGGNSGGGTNSAIKLLVPLGKCGNLTSSTFVYANEVTTAAAAYALGNFYTTSGGIGANGASGTQSYTGLTNAFATVNNLVSTSAGTAVTSQNCLGLHRLRSSIIVAPEASQLNTLGQHHRRLRKPERQRRTSPPPTAARSLPTHPCRRRPQTPCRRPSTSCRTPP